MSFRGSFQYVEVDIRGPYRVIVRALDEKSAANPETKIGVIVDMDNAIDRLLIVGDDAYDLGKTHVYTEATKHPWHGDEGFCVYAIDIKPDGTADMILELLNLKEK